MIVTTFKYYNEPDIVKILPCLLNEWATSAMFKALCHIFNPPQDALYKLKCRGLCLNNGLWAIDQLPVHRVAVNTRTAPTLMMWAKTLAKPRNGIGPSGIRSRRSLCCSMQVRTLLRKQSDNFKLFGCAFHSYTR